MAYSFFRPSLLNTIRVGNNVAQSFRRGASPVTSLRSINDILAYSTASARTHVSLEKHSSGVAIVRFNNPESKVNTLGGKLVEEFSSVLDEFEVSEQL